MGKRLSRSFLALVPAAVFGFAAISLMRAASPASGTITPASAPVKWGGLPGGGCRGVRRGGTASRG